MLTLLLIAFALTLTFHLVARPFGPGVLLSLDDGYIHASIARTFTSTGQFAIQPGAELGGSSSLLWTTLISILALFRIPADLAALLLGIASFLFLLVTVYRIASEILTARNAFYATLLLGLSGMQAALALTGMESQLATAFLFGGFGALIRRQKRFATVCLSLAVLTRPEMLLAPFALMIVRLLSTGNKGKKDHSLNWSHLGIITAVAISGLLLVSLLSGSLPSTFAARRWLYGLGEGWFSTQGPALPIYLRFITDLAHCIAGNIGPGSIIGWFWGLVVLELVISGSMVMWRLKGAPRAFIIFLFLQLIFVLFGLGSSGHLGRYLEPLWVSLPLLALVGWTRAMARLRDPLQRWLGVAVTVLLLAGFVPQGVRWAEWHTSSVRHLYDVHHFMAETVRRELPPAEPVAAFDIGLLAWESGHPIVDIGGLNSRAMVRRMYAGTVHDYLTELHVRWVILPAPRNPRLIGFMARRLGFEQGTLRVRNSWHAAQGNDYLSATRVAMPSLYLLEISPGNR
ncbi:hypothetical protein KQI63_13030 [bacterium]|nr:hypothetical protein [bacterium]